MDGGSKAWRSVGGYHREWDKYINEEVNLQDRFGGIALVTYEAQWRATTVGDEGGRQWWATTVKHERGWVTRGLTKSLKRVKHKRGRTGNQEDDEKP